MEDQNQNKKPLEILVVEDREENLAAAQQYFNEIGDNVDYASDYDTAIQKLKSKRYSGVITDLFFPRKEGSGDKSLGKKIVDEAKEHLEQIGYRGEALDLIQKLEEYVENGGEENQPLGAAIAEESYKRKIPSLIVTSKSGHGSVSLPILYDLQTKIMKKVGRQTKEEKHKYDLYLAIGDKHSNKNTKEEWKELYEVLIRQLQNPSLKWL